MITHFTKVPGESGNGRFSYLAEKLSVTDINLEVATSSFSHKNKKQRVDLDNQLEKVDYKLTTIYEPGYNTNVSIKRFYSHHVFGKNINKYLKTRKKPDLIYCSVPSLDVAATVARYAKENNIKFIIDIQDLWPEAFKMVFDMPIISNMIFYPMNKKADYIYKSADKIITVSETYLNRALAVNSKVNEGKVVFLGTELSKFDEVFISNKCKEKPENEIWITYIGTLGHSYDLTCVFDALEILKNKGVNNLRFIVMGDGPLKQKFEEYAQEKQINTMFTGRLPYTEMVGMLGVCDIAVNPIKAGSAGSIINKVGDYAAAGLPVVNTQESLEYRDLLNKYKAGLNCVNGDAVDVADKLLYLIKNPEIREEMGKYNRILAEEKFDRGKTYQEIIELIKDC